jgi:phosphotransferase system IIA component
MRFQKFGVPENTEYKYEFQLNNGQYIDNGDVLIRCVISADKLQAKKNCTTVTISSKTDDQTAVNDTNKNVAAFYRQ